ncbi:hypothetical protein VULLAG_LOCUS5051 [Vulpes lagopus]
MGRNRVFNRLKSCRNCVQKRMSDLPRPHRELTAVPEPKDIPPVFTLRSHHVRWHWDAPYCPLDEDNETLRQRFVQNSPHKKAAESDLKIRSIKFRSLSKTTEWPLIYILEESFYSLIFTQKLALGGQRPRYLIMATYRNAIF